MQALDDGTFDYDDGQLYVPTFFPAVHGMPGKVASWRGALITTSLAAFALPLVLHFAAHASDSKPVQRTGKVWLSMSLCYLR